MNKDNHCAALAPLADFNAGRPLLPGSFRNAGSGVSPFVRTSLAVGMSSALLAPIGATAAEEAQMAEVKVVEKAIDPNPYAEPGVPYKAKTSGDARHIRPLAETPQTISVLTQQQIQDSGRSDLRDILRAQPGITLGTGENGNAFGDRYIIRGQEARSDTFVDGLRDPGMSVRESFALDQVEITKGPSSTFAGRGATGGAINAVTKQATTDTDFTKLTAGVGSDNFRRITVDTNRVLSDDMALRINLLDAYQEVPDRGPADRSRKGAAFSFSWLPTDRLHVVADYYHLEAEDKPDLGTWLSNGKPVTGIPVYLQAQDFLRSVTDAYTLRLDYQASPRARLTNLTRYGTTSNGYVATGARATTFGANDPNAGLATATLSTHQGWQGVEYFANQTNLFLDAELAGLKHELIFGLEFSDHRVLNGNYTVSNSGQNCMTGSATANNAWCIYTGSGGVVANLRTLMNRQIVKGDADIDWRTKTVSLSAMDTVDLTEQWTLFGGLRYDHVDYRNQTSDRGTPYDWQLNTGLWNAHLGLTYRLLPYANLYGTYSTASDFNGGESDVTSCDYGGICVPSTLNGVALTPQQRMALFARSKPEKSENIELGTKWNLFDGKLLATAAAFQVTKSEVMEIASGTSYSSIGSINSGKYRIQGVEFGLAGNLTDQLSVQGGIAVMNAEWLASATASKLGSGLSNFPETTASLLLNYQLTPQFNLGGNVTYQAKKFSGTPESPEALNIAVPEYTVLDLFASYRIDRHTRVRLNVGNVTNEKYYLAAYRSGAFVYLGDARNARLTVSYDF